MKKVFAIAIIALASCGNDKKQDDNNGLPTTLVNNPKSADGIDKVAVEMKPVMKFVDTLHDFGNIREGEVVSYEFSFTNIGKTPLIITTASGSCGCTVPDYPKEPIAPGAAATLKVTFNSSSKTGHQVKSVTLTTNTAIGREMLYIQADVAPKQ